MHQFHECRLTLSNDIPTSCKGITYHCMESVYGINTLFFFTTNPSHCFYLFEVPKKNRKRAIYTLSYILLAIGPISDFFT